MSRFFFAGAALACAVLSGCATSSAPRSAASVAPYRDSIELSGRLAVNFSRDGKPESMQAPFSWVQTPARTDVSLFSPVGGSTLATISVTPDAATLVQSGKAPRTAADIDTLSAQTLGWPLPVSGLRDWLQGYAIGADGKRFVASPSNDSVITRDGWKLRYVTWQDDAAAVPQPKRIDVTRVASSQVEDMMIRIVINAPVTQ